MYKRQVLHHLPDQIIEYFGDGKKFGISISYHIETIPMGTAGALLQVLDLLADTFLVLYADVFTTINLNYFAEFHKKKCADIISKLGANSIKDMGKVMGELKKLHADEIDFAKAGPLIKELLSS